MKSNYNKLMALFKRMEEAEMAFAHGGLVRYESIKDLSFESFKDKAEAEIIKVLLLNSDEWYLKNEVFCDFADWR